MIDTIFLNTLYIALTGFRGGIYNKMHSRCARGWGLGVRKSGMVQCLAMWVTTAHLSFIIYHVATWMKMQWSNLRAE